MTPPRDSPALYELLRKADRLRESGRRDEALIAYTQAVDEYDQGETDLDWNVAYALAWKGSLLREADRNEDAITAYDEFLDRFDTERGDDDLAEQVLVVLSAKAAAQGASGDLTGALAGYDKLLSRVEQTGVALPARILEAHYGRGNVLLLLGRLDEAIQAFERVIELADTHDPVAADLAMKAAAGNDWALRHGR